MKLPNGENAIIDMEKLEGYCLSPDHGDGLHKALVFRAALGLRQSDASELKAALLEAAAYQDAVNKGSNQYGWVYVIDFEMIRPDARAVIRSVWIIEHGEIRPRLVTCYIRKDG
jgi:hypothetical protein